MSKVELRITNDVDSRWPHRVAVLMALVAFPLIWMGGLVTTTDAGMAVPDWPGTYSHNLWTFPWYDWFFGPWDLFVEHGHRLLGSLAGLIAIALVIVTWRCERRTWVFDFAVALLALVVIQGVLGGVRVLRDARGMAMIHGCVGPLFFAANLAFCAATSKWWARSDLDLWHGTRRGRALRRGAIVVFAIVFMQLTLGAAMRHSPVDARPGSFLDHAYTHLFTAGVLLVATGVHFARVFAWTDWRLGLRGIMVWLLVLIGVQIGLGLSTWVLKYGFPVQLDSWRVAAGYVIPYRTFWQTFIVTAHSATGSLLLGLWAVQVMRCSRLALARSR